MQISHCQITRDAFRLRRGEGGKMEGGGKASAGKPLWDFKSGNRF